MQLSLYGEFFWLPSRYSGIRVRSQRDDGFSRNLHVAATLNGALAAAAFFVSSAGLSARLAPNGPPPAVDHQIIYGLPRNSALLMLFTTGLVSMGLEVIWIRQFTPYLGNVVYAFAGILGTYLLATFWGSHHYRSWARSHSFNESSPSWSMLALFAVIPMVAADPLLPLRIGCHELGAVRLALSCFFVPSPVFLLRCSLIPGRWWILVRQGLHMRSIYWDPLLAPSWLGSGCCPGGVSVGPRSY